MFHKQKLRETFFFLFVATSSKYLIVFSLYYVFSGRAEGISGSYDFLTILDASALFK